MTFNPFGSVFSTALNGRRSREAAGAAVFLVGVAGFVFWAVARVARGGMRARRIAARARKRVMQASPSVRGIQADTRRGAARFHAGAYREDGSGASDGPPRRRARDPRWRGARLCRRSREPRSDGGRGALRAGPGRRGRAVDGAVPPQARRRASSRHARGPRRLSRGARANAKVSGLARLISGRVPGGPVGAGRRQVGVRAGARICRRRRARSHPRRARRALARPARRAGAAQGAGARFRVLGRDASDPPREGDPAGAPHARSGARPRSQGTAGRAPVRIDCAGTEARGHAAGVPRGDLARRFGRARVVRSGPRRDLRPRLPRGDEDLGAHDRAHSRRDRPGRRGPHRAARVRADGGATSGLRVAGVRGDLRGLWKAAGGGGRRALARGAGGVDRGGREKRRRTRDQVHGGVPAPRRGKAFARVPGGRIAGSGTALLGTVAKNVDATSPPACEREPYRTTLDASVLASGDDAGRPYVVLDDTILFPEGGGQPPDHGFLNDSEGLDVQKKGAEIRHYVAAPLAPGPARVRLDWDRRFDHMQQHTGQHLLSTVAQDRFGWQTTAFHLGPEVCDVELAVRALPPADLEALEEAVAAEIRAAHAVLPRRVTLDEFRALPVRTRGLPEGHAGDVRLVEIEGVDLNTCGGNALSKNAA